MLLCLRVSVSFGQPKVHNVDHVLVLGESYQEVVRFDVSVDEVVCVYLLKSLEQLVSQHENSLQTESP